MSSESHYRELDLEPTATREEIKRAYMDLVIVWHPDRFAHNSSLRAKAEQKLKRINIAYQFILERSTVPSATPERPRSHEDRPNRQTTTNSRNSTERGDGAGSESPSQQSLEAKKREAGFGIFFLLTVFFVVLILWRNIGFALGISTILMAMRYALGWSVPRAGGNPPHDSPPFI
jgi:hypothetical protein